MQLKRETLLVLMAFFWAGLLSAGAQQTDGKLAIANTAQNSSGSGIAAQQDTVEGRVIDSQDEETIPGVNIQIKGTTRGTTTDMEGEYSIAVSPADTLVFSFVGYQKQEVPVDDRNTINVTLRSQAVTGEEMVVVGYGTQNVDDNTGSITSISSDDFNSAGITSPGELFSGKVSGMRVTSNSGAPGAGSTIRIRGGSSLTASNDPLFVIDGVPMEGGSISGMRNPLNTINPNDIESVSVLKDASATAIYGSRASNGVIIITTKKGRKGQDLEVSYNAKFSYETQREQLDVLGADEFRDVIDNRFGEQGTQYLGDANTDWQDQIYENAFSQDHTISFQGSYGNLPFRASFGFTGNEGILRTSENDRLTGSVSLTPTFLDDQLDVQLNLKGMRVANRFANQSAIGAAVSFDPTQPVMADSSGAPYGGYTTWTDTDGNPIPIAISNPVALIEQTRDESTVYRSIGNVQFDYSPVSIPNVTATLKLGYDYSDVSDGETVIPESAAFQYTGPRTSGQFNEYDQRKENELLDFYVEYERDLDALQSSFDITAGYSWEHHYEEGSNYTTNYDRADTTVVDANTSYKTENYLVSFFGRMNYDFKGKYLFTGTLRQDGSSRFSEDNRWGLFPSAALAWQINEEPFMEPVESLSRLKLRLGYGVTGQQRIQQGDYPYLARYTGSEPTARYQFGDEFLRTLRPEGYNANLKWEETTTYNLGLDYGFYDNRLKGTVEAYYRETNDLLNVVPVPAGTNFTNRILSNVGTMEVKGLEFDITGTPIAREEAYLDISFNVTHNVNEITKLTTVDDPGYEGVETGGIAGGTGNTVQIHSTGHPRSAFYVYEQVYDQDGEPVEGAYVDRNGDGMITTDDKYRKGDPAPDVSFGLSSNFQYQNWDASFSARAQIGNQVYNNVQSEYGFYADMQYNQYVRNAPTSIRETQFYEARFHSDHYIEDASFLRMDNVSVGYTFNELLPGETSLRVSGTVRNAFVITEYDGLDPEVSGGIDNQIYPRPRTFIMGLNLNF